MIKFVDRTTIRVDNEVFSITICKTDTTNDEKIYIRDSELDKLFTDLDVDLNFKLEYILHVLINISTKCKTAKATLSTLSSMSNKFGGDQKAVIVTRQCDQSLTYISLSQRTKTLYNYQKNLNRFKLKKHVNFSNATLK